MTVGRLTDLDMLAVHLQDEDKHIRDLAVSTALNRGFNVQSLIAKFEARKAQGFPVVPVVGKRGRKRVFKRK